jgi:hypothetical protein
MKSRFLYSLFVQVRLSVQVPPAVCEDCYNRVINEFMKKAKVLMGGKMF